MRVIAGDADTPHPANIWPNNNNNNNNNNNGGDNETG
jgi:hypothetical protein